MTTRALTLLLLLAAAPAVSGQEVRTAVVPEAITVGDVFRAVIRVSGAGERGAVFPDSLELPPDLELAGRREVRRDTVAGALAWTAVYPLTAWRTGRFEIPAAEVRVAEDGGTRSAAAAFPAFTVRSVLPADTAGIEPKPAKDVLGANRVWWPLALGALALLLALAALLHYLRRRRAQRPAPVAAEPVSSPRERALAALAAARARGSLERGDLKTFYSDVSEALRGYLAALDSRFGMELTTTELAYALRAAGRADGTLDAQRVLQGADLVKFARRRPSAATAADDWERAREWVTSFELPPAEARAA